MTTTEQPPGASANPWPAALSSRPLLVHEAHAMEVCEAWLDAERTQRDPVAYAAATASASAPRYQIRDRVAIIPISGALISRGDFMVDGGGYTSYRAIQREAARAKADPAVAGVILGISSPGGTVDQILAASSAIRDLRAAKPVTAYVSGMACSAAYWLAAQADEIVLGDDLALVGSIGVYTMHVDVSRMLADYGIDVTLIKSGRHKAEGNPFEPLTKSVKDDFQQDVDDLRLMFAREVASGRAALTADAAMATEAKVYRAYNPRTNKREAIDNNLADRVATLDDAITSTARGLRGRQPTRSPKMSTTELTHTQAQLDAARAEGLAAGKAEGIAAAKAEGHAEGAKAERTRIGAILALEEAKGREASAQHLALSTDLSVDAAKGALSGLAAAPSATRPTTPTTPSRGPLGITVDPATSAGAKTTAIDAGGIYSARRKAVAAN